MESFNGVERRGYQRFSKEFKQRILRENLETGVPITVLARRHGIHPITVYNWRRNQMAEDNSNSDSLSPEKIKELILENSRLRREVNVLKSKIGDLFVDKEILEAALDVVKKKSLMNQLGSQEKSKNKKDTK